MTVLAPPVPPTGRRTVWLWLAAGAIALAYPGLAAFHIAYGALNADEGFYAAAARAVSQGEMPYRDFGFTQPPLVAYVNAAALRLTGFGLFEQRAVNGLWGILALLLAARLVARRAGPGWALLLLALFALTPAWMYFIHLGKTYGLASLLAMTMTTVFVEAPPGWRKMAALSAIGVLGVGCRLPAAPFFGALWLAALWHGQRPSPRLVSLALLILVACVAACILPFYLAAPDQTIFWTFDFHRVSVPKKDWRLRWDQIATLAPAVWILALLAIILAVIRRRQWRQRETTVIVAALAALAVNLLPRGVYEEYGVLFLPPLATAAFLLFAPVAAEWAKSKRLVVSLALLAGPVLLIPVLSWRHLSTAQRELPSIWLPTNTHPYNFALPANLRRATEAVQRLLPPHEDFLGPNLILAVEAGRPIPRTLRMGPFSMTADFDTATADRLHLMTFSAWEKRLRDIDVPLVVLHTHPVLNYVWSVPSFDFQSPEDADQWGRLIDRYFVPVHLNPDFVVLARPHLLPVVPPH